MSPVSLRSTLRLLPSLLLAATLCACGGNEDADDATQATSIVSGTAAVGAPLIGGTVTATCNGIGPGSGTTGNSGSYSLTILSTSFPCVLQLTGGTANGAPNTTTLHSLAIGAGTTNITPLTDLALALSINTAAGKTLTEWLASPANWSTVESGLSSALDTLRSALLSAGYEVPANWSAGSAAPLNATFTPDPASDPFDALLEALATAIEDSAVYSDYAALLQSFASGGSTLPAVEEEDEDEPGEPEASAGLALVATYAGTYPVTGTGHTRGTVTIGGNGASIDFDTGKTFSIQGTNVYNRISNFPSEPRVQIELFPAGAAQQRIRIFVDPLDTTRVLSFVFYPSVETDSGAITVTVDSGSGSQLPAPNGDGATLGDADGATGTLNGTTYTYTGNVQWSSMTGGFLAYEATGGSFNPLTQWHLGGVPATVGTHTCKSNIEGTLPRIQRVVNTVNYDTAPTGGACIIEVQSVSAGAITGRFSATLVDQNGTVVGTVTDGYFRKAVSTGGGTLPPGEVGASFVVDGTTYRYTEAARDNYDGFPGGVFRPIEPASPGYSVGFQIHTLPLTAGTAICDTPADGSNNYRKTNMQFYWNDKWYYAGRRANPEPGPTGSSCTVVVSQINDSLLEGSFDGTFVADDGASITVTDGLFRQQSGT